MSEIVYPPHLVLLRTDNVIHDSGIDSLVGLARVLDQQRTEFDEELAVNRGAEWLREAADDLAGLGFVACQRYLTQVASYTGISRAKALALGPETSRGQTVASAIDFAANAWKHEAEWGEELDRRQARTCDGLSDALTDGGWEWKYANALYAITPDSRFTSVVKLLEAWRDAMLAASGQRHTAERADPPAPETPK